MLADEGLAPDAFEINVAASRNDPTAVRSLRRARKVAFLPAGTPPGHRRCRLEGDTTMSDDNPKSGGQEARLISLSEADEVRDWATTFGVTQSALRKAARKVGNNAEDVERELKA